MTGDKSKIPLTKLSVFLAITIASFGFLLYSCNPPGQEKTEYVKEEKVVHAGKSAVFQHKFKIDDLSATKVSLSIKDEKLTEKDIVVVLGDEEVDVVNGEATAELMFGADKKTPLGAYSLPIVIKNTATGEILHEESIPFVVKPPEGC